MNELPRVNTHNTLVYAPQNDVVPTTQIVTKAPLINEHERRQLTERRKQKRKPVIERRVSSDRRSALFDAKA